MLCATCEAENPDRAKFCVECASPFARRCPACNAENPPTAKFCFQCAKPLETGAMVATANAPSESPARDGERRHLTVLFSDLVNSTEIAAHLDPEDWRDIAAEYQVTAAAAVTRFGGHVAKYLGDGLMVYFGWPEAHEDDAERAVRAGLAIVDEVGALNRRLAPEPRVKLSVRVGVQTGSVVMGHGGGPEPDIFGDTPNVASRVQSAAEPGSVLITAAVLDLISGLFVVEDRGAHQLKGIEYPVQLYRAIQPVLARRRTHRAAVEALSPFVGREGEMRMLLNRWEQTNEGRGQLVLVIGEPGIGKSRLVDEFHARIQNKPHLWVECAGDRFSRSTPFQPVTQILNQGLGWRGDESPIERVAQLERNLELAGLRLGEAVPLIAEMLGLPVPDRYPRLEFAPELRRRRLLANLTAWVLNAARVQPLVLVMEDLHWIDPSTLEIAQTLVEQAATAPLMLLCTARPEFRAPWPLRAHHAQITLSRLNDRDMREIIASVVTGATLTRDLIDTVLKRTDGVPLFAEELTRLILGGDRRSVALEIPATLRDSLTARLDRLGPAKEVAQIAAVIGREFSFELLQAVGAIEEGELQLALEELVGAELIYARGVAPEATYQFKHALIQDAAYETLLKTKRRELHRRVAQTIRQKLPAVAEEQPELIARHWTEAGARELALAAWKKAAEAAFERRAFKEAEEAYRQALATIRSLPESSERDAQELELVIRFVQVLQATKGWAAPEAADAAAHAQKLAEKTNNLKQLVVQMAGLFAAVVTSANYPTASAVADQVLDLANREGSPACLGTAHACHITVSYFRGDLSRAEKHFTAGAAMLEPAGKIFSSALGAGFGYGGHTAWLRGFPDVARERIRLAIAGSRELKSPFEQAYTQWLAAKLQLFLRNFELAKTAAAESAALSEGHGFRLLAAGATFYLGLAEAAAGHPDSAMPRINLGFRGMEESRALGGMTIFLSWLAAAQALNGKTAEALDTAERALQANPAELYVLPEALRIRGELRLRHQQTELAEADFRNSLRVARNQGAKSWELRSATSLARLLRDRGDRTEARDLIAPIYGWFTEGFDTADLKDARSLLDELNHQNDSQTNRCIRRFIGETSSYASSEGP